MLASPSATPGVPPGGPEWVHEVKWDGIRLMASVSDGRLQLTNRSEIDVSVAYPELVEQLSRLPSDLLLDGEVIALDSGGRPNLQALMPRMHVRDRRRIEQLRHAHPVSYMAFDVLRLDGLELTGVPLSQRRDVLDSLDLPARTGSVFQTPPQYDDGALLAQATKAQGLEGVVSKRRSSLYRPGTRSEDWVKAPHRAEILGVIGGWVPETDTENRLGALWLGLPGADYSTTGLLEPLARVGSGLPHATRASLLQVLRQSARDTPPFTAPLPPGPELRRSHWSEPAIVVECTYLGRTESGLLRQPTMKRLRPELLPEQTVPQQTVEGR